MTRFARPIARLTHTQMVGLSLLLLLPAMWLSAQDAPLQFRVDSLLLPLEVIVKDANGRPVLDLKQEEFEIYENGALQKMSYFALAEAPRSTLLIFDRSGSVEDHDTFIAQAIRVFTKAMRSSDRIAIFSFAHELEVRLKWQSIRNDQLPTVKMPPTQPWSAVYESLERAAKRFENEKGRRGIIMLTDGNDSDFFGETRELGGVLNIEKDSDFLGYLQRLRKQNVPVYFIALNPDPRGEFAYLNGPAYRTSSEYARSAMRSPKVGEDFLLGARRRMEKIAEATGGRVLVPSGLEQVASFYDRIARELGESYSLGYTPADATAGGEYRRIEVRVRRPGLTVKQSRDGFQP